MQPVAGLGVVAQPLDQMIVAPAGLANDDEVPVKTFSPQDLEGVERYAVSLARLDRPDHQEGATARRSPLGRGRRPGVDAEIRAEMPVADLHWPRKIDPFQHGVEFVGDRSRNADEARRIAQCRSDPRGEDHRHVGLAECRVSERNGIVETGDDFRATQAGR